jgi:formylglycine-generating enzyme required for sulfatase activity
MGTDAAKVPEIAAGFNISKHPELIQAETPQHNVTIESFYLDQFEVTNAAFRRFIRARPEWSVARIPRSLHNGNYLKDWNGDNFPKGKANHPVASVSWYAAAAFCQWRGKRLPTEAEWELAARGGLKDKTFPWGDEPVAPSRANYGGSKLGGTSPVGSYPPNGYALFDMAGNVWEFTADEWAPYPNPGSSPTAREGALITHDSSLITSVVTRRVIRGGSFAGAPLNLRVTYRDSHPPDGAQAFVGFRCAK